MPRPLYTNNAQTTLATGITSTATSIQVASGSGSLFPNPSNGDYFYVTLVSISLPTVEIVQCTARSGDVLTVNRGQEGTSPQPFNIGDGVQLRITAAGMNYLVGASSVTTEEQVFTATQGQTVFNLTNIDYVPNTNSLAVFVNGSKQVTGVNYTETNVTTFTLTTGANAGDIVEAIAGLGAANGTLYATDIKYNEGATNAVTRTLETKLQETVSVLDFGADPTGNTDSSTAIANAIAVGSRIFFPPGTYLCNIVLNGAQGITLSGASQGQYNGTAPNYQGARLVPYNTSNPVITIQTNSISCVVENLLIDSKFDSTYSGVGTGILLSAVTPYIVQRCVVRHVFIRGFQDGLVVSCNANNGECYDNYFEDIDCIGISRYSFSNYGVYNVFNKIFAVSCGSYTLLNYGNQCLFNSVVGDGRIYTAGAGVTFNALKVEWGSGSNSGANIIELNGNTTTMNSVVINGVPNANFPVGLSIFGNNQIVNGFTVTGSAYPNTPILLNASSNGVLINASAPNLIETNSTLAEMYAWRFINCTNTKYTSSIQSLSGSVSTANSTSTGFYTLPQEAGSVYIVSIYIALSSASVWSSTYLVSTQQTTANVTALQTGSGSGFSLSAAFSVSGILLSVNQSSGSTQTVNWTINKLI